MKYTFRIEELTCVNLETELGLKRGDVISITVHSEGEVEVETREALSSTNESKLTEALDKRKLPRREG